MELNINETFIKDKEQKKVECKNYNLNYSSGLSAGKPHQKKYRGKKIFAKIEVDGEYYCDYCWMLEKDFWKITASDYELEQKKVIKRI